MKKKQTAPKAKQIRNLVIGSEGFLGTALCKFLEKKGESVQRFDVKRGAHEDARTANLHLENYDRVYFLAWEVGGAKYLYREDTQLHQLNWNLDLLRNVMMQLQENRKPFAFVSSQLADESDTIYGVLKRTGELWTELLQGVCIRLWNIYGDQEDHDEKSHVISDFVLQAVTTGKIQMMTTGEERRQFTHTLDVCEGLHMLMEQNLHSKIYDLTHFEWTPIKRIAEIIAEITDAEIVPGQKRGVDRSFATVKGKAPGWYPQIKLEDGLKAMVKEAKAKHKSAKK